MNIASLQEMIKSENWLIRDTGISSDCTELIYGALASVLGREDDSSLGDDSEGEEVPCTCYTADFETTTELDDCRVWAAATCEIGNPDHIERGIDIEWFIDWCEQHGTCNVYFHNLAFDGAFIMDYLERHDWKWVDDRSKVSDRTYTTVISDSNQVYCVTLYFRKGCHVKIMDSLKIVPLSIAQMANAYKLPILKGEIDYSAPRPVGHQLTDEEIRYLDHDVKIAAMVMDKFLTEGLTKMTAGSNALTNYKEMIQGQKGFRKWFPFLSEEEDTFIRKSYRGGFTWVNPKFQGKVIGRGIVFDVNSLYPSVMNSCAGERLPYGKPVWVEGKPKPSKTHDLWVAQVTCSFRVKEGHIPCIQLKGNYRFSQTEYLTKSDGDVTFTVTSVDWELIKQQYHVYNLRWHGAYQFKSATFLFKSYIDKWITVKNQSTIDGNSGMRQIAKLMLNSLYGKFATRTTVYSRRPMIVNDVLRYVDLPPQQRDPVYLPVGVFVTAWARKKTITAAQAVYDRFLYADTDSIHLVGDELPTCIDIDDVRLGAWKHESTFDKAKFLRAKCYMEYQEGKEKPTVHVAGMPSVCHKYVDLDNFEFGATYDGKLYTHRVKGGIVLKADKMQIRE